VHLAMTAPALARRIDPALRWTLPAYARYETEVDPARFADVVVRVDDPRHPALVESGPGDGPGGGPGGGPASRDQQ
jgi:hypothetical protein